MTDDEQFSRSNSEESIEYRRDHNVKITVNDEEQKSSTVKNIIQKFESGSIYDGSLEENEFGEKKRNSVIGNPGTVNPIQTQFAQFFLDVSRGRDSNISVNSILSGASEGSFSSGSSYGTSSFRNKNKSNKPSSRFSSSHSEQEDNDVSKTRLSSFSSNGGSPVAPRKRMPPVIRKKSIIENHKELNGDTIWTYGVQVTDLEERLKGKADYETETEGTIKFSEHLCYNGSETSDESNDDTDRESLNANGDDDSTLHSTDTLIEGVRNENFPTQDLSSSPSSASGELNNADNVSIRSVSSFEMIHYHNYNRVSDEFGADSSSVMNDEFFTVSAQNEFTKTTAAIALPKESKKTMYRRQLTERVNELLRTEDVYVNKLRHVIEDYIPDLPPHLEDSKSDIFVNIDKIYEFHSEEFLPALLEARHDLVKLAECFQCLVQNEQNWLMYSTYSSNNKRSNRLVYENKKYFEERGQQLDDRLGLSSYLLEPVQRLPRYKLFLNDLAKTYEKYEKECAETESITSKSSFGSCETTESNDIIECNERVLESLREAKALMDTLLTTIDCVIELENIGNCPFDVLKQGRLLKQNEFYVLDLNKTRRHMRVFLCEKVLLFTTVHKKYGIDVFLYYDHIPTDLLGITPKEYTSTKIRVWYKKPHIKNYKLEGSDSRIIDEWKNELSELLWKQAKDLRDTLQRHIGDTGSVLSMTSQNSSEGSSSTQSTKYNSLRGVPGEVKRAKKCQPAVRTTTWYCE